MDGVDIAMLIQPHVIIFSTEDCVRYDKAKNLLGFIFNDP